MKTELRDIAANIKLLILDVDGVLTDGRLYYSAEGESLKVFHVHDGAGIKRLLERGIHVAALSSRTSACVTTRLTELGVAHIYQGQADKTAAFFKLCKELQIAPETVAYVGDDLVDLTVMKLVGLSVAVANAMPAVKDQAHYQTQQRGGEGAVREVCELIISALSK